MTMQDTLSDMLTRVRNAQRAGHLVATVPSSKLKLSVCEVLKQEGYIAGYEKSSDPVKPVLTITLKYYAGEPVIEELKRISKPSLRIYAHVDEIPSVKGGLGVAIISTPKGVVSDKQARKLGCGGEVLATVA